MADREATTHADLYHRHGDPDPSKWDEAEAVTGRPADKPSANSTLAERAKQRTPDVAKVNVEEPGKAKKAAPAKKAAARKGKA